MDKIRKIKSIKSFSNNYESNTKTLSSLMKDQFKHSSKHEHLRPQIKFDSSKKYLHNQIQDAKINQKSVLDQFRLQTVNQVNSARQKNNTQNTTSMMEQHYDKLERVFNQKNSNLKKHIQFLMAEINKMKQKQQVYLSKINKYRKQFQKLKKQNSNNASISSFILSFIIKIQKHYYSSNIEQIMRCLRQLLLFLKQKFLSQKAQRNYQINLTQIKSNLEEKHQMKERNQFQYHQNKGISSINSSSVINTLHSEDSTLQKDINNLNNKFQVLMYEYKKTNKPDYRKKCLQIIKQMKELKQQQLNMINIHKNNLSQENIINKRNQLLKKNLNKKFQHQKKILNISISPQFKDNSNQMIDSMPRKNKKFNKISKNLQSNLNYKLQSQI